MNPDPLTMTATPVTAVRSGRPLWQGSGFYYVHQRGSARFLFLVTARHLLYPGHNDDSEKPDELLFQFHDSHDAIGSVRAIRAALYTRDGAPAWISRECGPADFNVALLPIPGSLCEGVALYCVDRSTADPAIASLEPGGAVHVVGFAQGLHEPDMPLPVWQTGHLANDPGALPDARASYLVNVGTHPGMAGAISVIDRPSAAGENHRARRFVGMYAGAAVPGQHDVYPEHLSRHLSPTAVTHECGFWGHVWRAEAIFDLADSVDIEAWQRDVLANLP